MRNVFLCVLWIAVVAAAPFPSPQDRRDIAPANSNLVPQDFTVDDVPISIELPFEVLVDGTPWQGRTIGWHIDRVLLHSETGITHLETGSTMWLGLTGRGMYILSLAPREGYNFQKAGAIRDNVIAFDDGDSRYEIRTSGPILGSDKAWNLWVLHLPEREMKGPLFGVDRLGHCTLGFLGIK